MVQNLKAIYGLVCNKAIFNYKSNEIQMKWSQKYLINGKHHEIQFMALSDLSEICFIVSGKVSGILIGF